jgi:hypothetical protein
MADLKAIETRSTRAAALLNDTVLIEALKSVRERAVSDWDNTQPGETAAREYHWHRVRAVDDLRKELESFAADAAVRKFNKKEPKA